MKFGVREICDVTFKAAAQDQKVGKRTFNKYQPVFTIDTAQTSEMSQESTTVYAQGGKGYNRLIAWEGEKTMTFTVTDALISPMGLAVLTGAGLIEANDKDTVHVHVAIDAEAKANGSVTIDLETLAEEIGKPAATEILVCSDVDAYGTLIDGSGYGYAWLNKPFIFTEDNQASDYADSIAVDADHPVVFKADTDDVAIIAGKNVKVDFYVAMKSGATQVNIEPDSFGGYFYVEADTLFRREDDGQDMAATLTFPRVKVQSAFTFTMAATGDPSTFDFTMDAFPGYTQFDHTKKVNVTMAIVGDDEQANADSESHSDHSKNQ